MNPTTGNQLRGRVLVLTDAGISVASGISPFRGDDGLYEGLNPYDLASPRAFAARPVTVWNWYLMRIHQGLTAKPNPAHFAIAEMQELVEDLTLVTSNVDPLHEQAGSTDVKHLHGRILEFLCAGCGEVTKMNTSNLPETIDIESLFRCPCGSLLRPNVVWFGEYPWSDAVQAAHEGIQFADAILDVGSSGVVSYGFAEEAARRGKLVLRINPEPEEHPGITTWPERAEVALPQLISWLRS